MMDRQRQQEGPAQAGPPQKIQPKITLKIATNGAFEIRNARAFFQQGGQEVTELQPDQDFEIHCDYEIRNSQGGATWWSTAMTVFNVTDNVAEGVDEYGQHLGSSWKSAADAININNGISKNVNYRVSIFANQAANAGSPPTSEW
jgi:hypothetical protein